MQALLSMFLTNYALKKWTKSAISKSVSSLNDPFEYNTVLMKLNFFDNLF